MAVYLLTAGLDYSIDTARAESRFRIWHVEALLNLGAAREEVGSVLAMAVQMGGGPALMYAAHALAAWDEMTA